MSGPWEGIRERLRAGDPVTVDEIAEALAAEPTPRGMPPVVAAPEQKRRPGRPRKWSARDVRAIETLCARVRFWSEMETADGEGMCAPLPWEEIYRRVSTRLRSPMTGRSLEELLRRRRQGRSGFSAARVPEDDMLAVLNIEPDD